MGVRGLQSYFESHCGAACYSVNLAKLSEDYHKKTGRYPLIVIDGMSCLRKIYGKLNWICGGQWKGYVENMENFVKKLRTANIQFVFFFDGNTPSRKRETWVHRRLENLKDVANYFNVIKAHKELEHGKHFFIPPGLAAFTPLILKDVCKCEVYTCLDECDKEVAEYGKKHGAMGILGQDSDYAIYNTAPYYFSINHLNLETLDTLVYDRASLARVLHIAVDQLPVLSCLIGNDVIPQDLLGIFHKQFLKDYHGHGRHHTRPPPEVLIPKVGQFISNQPPLEQMMNNLPSLAKAVFKEESMAKVLGEGISMYVLDLSPEESYFQINEEQRRQGDIIERVRLRHMNSELGRHLYTIMRGEPYESSTTIEDYSTQMLSNCIVYRPLRAKIYAILDRTLEEGFPEQGVEEWCMYNGNTLKEPDYVIPDRDPQSSGFEENYPSLDEIWNSDIEFRWKCFLGCLNKKLLDTHVRTLPQYLIAPACLLFYLQCSGPRPVLKEWEVSAFLVSFITPIRSELNSIRSLSFPRTDSRAVHLATLFIKGLVNVYMLLAACDFPMKSSDCVPWKFWDGKVFQYMYLKGKSGSKMEDLLDKKPDAVKIFVNIRNLIVSNTPAVVIPKTKVATPCTSTGNSPKGSPKKKTNISPSPSNCATASPPSSPAHPPTTLAINKSANASSANASPGSPNKGAKNARSPAHSKSPNRPKSPMPKTAKKGS